MCHRLVDGKPRLSSRVHRVHKATGSSGKKDRHFMLMDGEEEQRCGLSVQVCEISSLESRICGKNVWQVKAKGQLALEPGLYRVPGLLI